MRMSPDLQENRKRDGSLKLALPAQQRALQRDRVKVL